MKYYEKVTSHIDAGNRWKAEQERILQEYKKEHPNLITFLGEEVHLQNSKHFTQWRKERGYE